MNIWLGALVDMITGKPDNRGKWANPNCASCRGTGYPMGIAQAERCFCVNNAIIDTARLARIQGEQRQQMMQANAARPYWDRFPIVDMSDVEVRKLSPAETEQLRI